MKFLNFVQEQKKTDIKKLFSISLLGLVVIQFCALLIFNLKMSDKILDFDYALEARHAIEMWKNRSIFLENWNYVSTLEIDTAVFWAAPIYILTNNFSFSIAVTHAIFASIFIVVILDIYSNLNRERWEAYIAVLLVFTPYTIEQSSNNLDYNNMLFVAGGQYEFRVLTILLLLDTMICKNVTKRIKLTIIYSIFLFWTSLSCGNYVLLMGVLPVFLGVFIEQVNKMRINVLSFRMKVIFSSILLAMAAILIKSNSVAGNSFRNSLSLISADSFSANIENCFVGVFLLIRALRFDTGISVLSLDGIIMLIKIMLVLISMILPIYGIFKCVKLQRNSLIKYVVSIMFVNIFVLIITNTQYGSWIFEARYHILWFVVVLVCLPWMYREILIGLNNKYYYYGGLSLALIACVILNIYGFCGAFRIKNGYYDKAKAIIEKTNELQVDTVYVFEDAVTANIIRVLDYDLNCYRINNDSEYNLDVLNFYIDLNGNEKNLLFIPETAFQNLEEDKKDNYEFTGKIDDINVYISDINPWI